VQPGPALLVEAVDALDIAAQQLKGLKTQVVDHVQVLFDADEAKQSARTPKALAALHRQLHRQKSRGAAVWGELSAVADDPVRGTRSR
jgi:hypothetical protein